MLNKILSFTQNLNTPFQATKAVISSTDRTQWLGRQRVVRVQGAPADSAGAQRDSDGWYIPTRMSTGMMVTK